MELIQGWENSDKPEESEQSKRNYTGRDSSNNKLQCHANPRLLTLIHEVLLLNQNKSYVIVL